jgi:PAS domain S-box-containing protein
MASLKRAGAYLAAALLPWPCVLITLHSRTFHSTPLALSFILVAVVARLLGRGPALVSVLSTTLLFNFYCMDPVGHWSSTPQSLLQCTGILAIGGLIVFLFQLHSKTEQELLRSNAALQEESDALTQAQRGSNSAAWVYDARTQRTTWHRGGAEIFGRPLEECNTIGSSTELVLEEDRRKITSAIDHTARTGAPFHAEFRVRWPNGEVHWLQASGSPEASNPSLWRGVTFDITSRKNMELALAQSEKLAAALRLASSVSHEINNPLEAVTNLLYLAKLSAADPAARKYLETAEKEIARIAQVTIQMLRFHTQRSTPEAADIAAMIAELLDFYESRLTRSKIHVEFDPAPAPPVVCHAGEMRQALANLFGNALDAMPNGGRLIIRVRQATDWRSDRSGLRITIADTGRGISAHDRRHIYEPFFTTRDHTSTGLGLWITAGIINRHGGSIHVRSRMAPGVSGTAFNVILLPVGIEMPPPAELPSAELASVPPAVLSQSGASQTGPAVVSNY